MIEYLLIGLFIVAAIFFLISLYKVLEINKEFYSCYAKEKPLSETEIKND